MADPKSPKKPTEAGTLKAEQAQAEQAKPLDGEKGKYDMRSKVETAQSEDQSAEEEETYTVNIELQDDQGKPVTKTPSGGPIAFQITVAGEVFEGELDDQGKATVEGMPEKQCEVSFPDLHADEWKKK